MPCYLHYNLLVDTVLVQLGGGRGPQGMIGVVAWKASKFAHIGHSSAELINTSWSIHVPRLAKVPFTRLHVEGIAGPILGKEGQVFDDDS